MNSEELVKNRRKKYHTLKDLITGWAVILKSKTVSKKGRVKSATYFIQQVKNVRLRKSNMIIIETDYPIYVERNWEDVSPRMNMIKLNKSEIKIVLDGIDLDDVIISENLHEELKEYVNKRLEEVLSSDGDNEEDEEENEVF